MFRLLIDLTDIINVGIALVFLATCGLIYVIMLLIDKIKNKK
jgi:hypothetical protein